MPALAQRRLRQAQHAEAVVEVGAETAIADSGFEIMVRGRDDAHVDAHGVVPAEALVGAFLQEAQQRGLALHRQIADLVQEQGAAMGHLDAAELAAGRAGEGAALVAEQFGLDQRMRDGAAVDRDEGHGGASRLAMQRLRGELLAGAGLAGDEHRRLGHRRLAQRAREHAHGRALADDAVEPRVGDALRRFAGQPRHAMRVADHGVEHRFGAGQGDVVVAVVAHQPAHGGLLQLRGLHARHPAHVGGREHRAEGGDVGFVEAVAQVDDRGEGALGCALHDLQHRARVGRADDVPSQCLQPRERLQAPGGGARHVDDVTPCCRSIRHSLDPPSDRPPWPGSQGSY